MLKLMYAEQRPTNGTVQVAGFDIGQINASDVPRLRRKLAVSLFDAR